MLTIYCKGEGAVDPCWPLIRITGKAGAGAHAVGEDGMEVWLAQLLG